MTGIRKTRFVELGYVNICKGCWRIVDLDSGKAIGPHYATRAELLADLDRYAKDYGCE